MASYKKILGPDHISTFTIVNNLGLLYNHQEKMANAEMVYLRAFASKKKALGTDYILILNTVNFEIL